MLAATRGQDLQLILTRFGVERLLYRLGHLSESARFVLKGAALFYLWEDEIPRPTQDVDFLGFGDSSPEAVAQLFRDVCRVAVVPDGLIFVASSVKAARIRGRQEYGGVRVKLTATLGGARVPLQVDVGFGDAVTPRPTEVEFPTLLDFPAPRVRAYPPETVVAEKFQAMVVLGIANTRTKDFFDLFHLAETHEFNGAILAEAIGATFHRRRTAIPAAPPLALTPAFSQDAEKTAQWNAFLQRGRLEAPSSFVAVIERIAAFVLPPTSAALERRSFETRWSPSTGWSATK